MSETATETINQNLRTIFDRYSLVGADSDLGVADIKDGDRNHLKSLDSRKGRLYGELTSHGLTLIWSRPERAERPTAEVLIVDNDFVVTGSHTYSRRDGTYDWGKDDGSYTSISLIGNSDPLVAMPYELSVDRKTRGQAAYIRTAQALAKFAAASHEFDALHQTVATRSALVHNNLAQLYPYAGQLYGPRVNLEEMVQAGVPFHPAVFEALQAVPDMTVDS